MSVSSNNKMSIYHFFNFYFEDTNDRLFINYRKLMKINHCVKILHRFELNTLRFNQYFIHLPTNNIKKVFFTY